MGGGGQETPSARVTWHRTCTGWTWSTRSAWLRSSRAFDEPWSPKIVAELNDSYVKVVKLEGEFVWHHHDDEDELFLVVSGRLRMQFRDGDVWSSRVS